MSIRQAELYEALIVAGAPEDKAHAAAVAVADIIINSPKPETLATKDYVEKRVAQLERKIIELRGEFKVEITRLGGRISPKIIGLEGKITRLGGRMDSKIAESGRPKPPTPSNHQGRMDPKIAESGRGIGLEMSEVGTRLIRQKNILTAIIIAAIGIATGILLVVN